MQAHEFNPSNQLDIVGTAMLENALSSLACIHGSIHRIKHGKDLTTCRRGVENILAEIGPIELVLEGLGRTNKCVQALQRLNSARNRRLYAELNNTQPQ